MLKRVETKTGAQKGTANYTHLFRLLHWVVTLSFLALFLSGLSLHAIARPERSLFSGVIPSFLWEGRVQLWHFIGALVFCPALLGTIFISRRRTWTRPVHAILFSGGLVLIFTGLLMFHAMLTGQAASFVVWVHGAVAMMLMPVAFLWHVLESLVRRIRLLIPVFHPFAFPQWKQVFAFLAVTPVIMWGMLACWPSRVPSRSLVATAIDRSIDDQTSVKELPWDSAQPVTVQLSNGVGFRAGQTPVTLRALHTDDELFVLAQWKDPTEDRRYSPWKKTRDGWEHLKTNAKDECVYYEDKFALAFPIESDWRFEQVGCALYCHAGGGNSYGGKQSDRMVDVWHWKATRTDPSGQADDKYWFKPESEDKISGRFGDPKDGGGYKTNQADDAERPACLPADPAKQNGGAILGEDAIDYTEAMASAIEPGTIVPGMISSPFEGDRGDVKCESVHRNGEWALYYRRKLVTGSEYDVQFRSGESHAFACAAFDHASKRHAYSFNVFHLLLE